MRYMTFIRGSFIPALFALVVVTAGCDRGDAAKTGESKSEQKTETAAQPKPATQPLIPVAMDWCREHEMPESVCVQCHPELAAGFKAKGDWDEEHKLPKSQCFKCDPSARTKFAAAFKEKYGKEPPAPEPEEK